MKDFDVILKPDLKEIEPVISQGLSRHPYPRRIKEAVCSFINDCAAQFLTHEEAVYSLKYTSGESGIVELSLTLIDPFVVLKILNNFFRVIIRGHDRYVKVIGISKLTKDSIVIFKPPKSVRTGLRNTKRNLVVLDSRRIPDWSLFTPAYSLEILKAQSLAVLEATRPLGWNARRTANEDITEYYYFDRFLTFEKFKIELRNSILETLNNMLNAISPTGMIAPEIIIKGLPSLEAVDEAREKLREGPTKFEEIIAPFLHH